jgi:uncharacterized protein YceK
MRQLVVAVMGAVLTAGCSAMLQKAASDKEITCHYAHMASIEKQAHAANVSVRWVNCPLIPNDPTPEGTPVRVATVSR